MHLTSVVVMATPEKMPGIKRWIQSTPVVTVAMEDLKGVFVVTIEHPDLDVIVETVNTLGEIDGVVGVTPSFHFFDGTETEQREPS